MHYHFGDGQTTEESEHDIIVLIHQRRLPFVVGQQNQRQKSSIEAHVEEHIQPFTLHQPVDHAECVSQHHRHILSPEKMNEVIGARQLFQVPQMLHQDGQAWYLFRFIGRSLE